MFGGLAFLVGGNMAVAASGQGGLMVRVDPAETEALSGQAARAAVRDARPARCRAGCASTPRACATKRQLEPWVEARRGVRALAAAKGLGRAARSGGAAPGRCRPDRGSGPGGRRRSRSSPPRNSTPRDSSSARGGRDVVHVELDRERCSPGRGDAEGVRFCMRASVRLPVSNSPAGMLAPAAWLTVARAPRRRTSPPPS